MNTSLDTFVTVLRRSGLIDEAVVSRDLDTFRGTNPTPSAETFAEYLTARQELTGWQAAKLLQGRHKGFFLGKYKLLKLLGKGGMSSVYLAEHVLMKRRCAIKVLPTKFVNDSSYLQRFHREAQAVAALDHPNIVRAYDIDHEKDGNVDINFLVMEFVEGRNLHELVLNDGPLSCKQAVEFVRQGAHGLEHAHKAGMVHRDVKPGNFIVDANGVVKLMDLGLARMHTEEDDQSLTLAHDEKVLGTADYLAPEQAVDSHSVDHRADIYSLGCTLYFLLTGKPPFHEGTLTQRLLAHQTKTPPPVGKFRSDVPASLLAILDRMMAKDREKRMQTATEVEQELTAWLKNDAQPATAAASPPPKPTTEKSPAERPAAAKRPKPTPPPAPATPPPTPRTSSPPAEKPDTPPPTRPPVKREIQAESELGSFLSTLLDTSPVMSTVKRSGAGSSTEKSPTKPPAEPGPCALSDVHSTGEVPAEGSGLASDSKASSTSGSKQLGPAGSWKLPRRRVLIAGACLAVALIGFLVFRSPFGKGNAVVAPEPKPTETTQETSRPAVDGPVVTIGETGHFGTLGEAIQYLERNSGDTPVREIQIPGGRTLRENVLIDNSRFILFPKGLRIVGIGDKPAILAGATEAPILTINDIEGLTVENLTIDCGSSPTAVALQGYLSATRFVGLSFEKAKTYAIRGTGINGLAGQEFVLDRCRFAGGSEQSTLVRLEPSEVGNTRKVLVRGCRFLGPGNVGLAVEGTVTDLTVRESLFHATRDAIRLTGTDQAIDRLILANNTFHDFHRGIAFESGPVASCKGISLTQNLFVAGQGAEASTAVSDVDVDKLAQGTPASQSNWSDQAPVVDSTRLAIFKNNGVQGEAVPFVSTDPGHAEFLKPSTADVRTRVKQPVGPLNFIGAVSP